ncbi:homoserine dehydrogenase [Virgibacillus halophilus]|uniref:homoserine dehydrogenase n=1 Tax=Tigheibacillus halophilus TaxID=361280 RepID=UPI00363FE7DE
MQKQVSIGLLGFGVVGSGVVKMIENHREELSQKLGCDVTVKHILVRDKEKQRDLPLHSPKLTTDPAEVLNDPDIDIIVEVMGGIEEARKHIRHALQNKKHVVTANKDLIALHGQELLEVASENHCDLFYEASVGGGIPVLRGLTDGLISDRIQEVMGIVNGTTNYILTKMDEDHVSFDKALGDAQNLGFAEADPTADIEGLDAARKMAILSRLAFSMNVELDDVETSGITDIALKDLEYGNQLGYVMKLIGFAKKENGSIEISVQPTFFDKKHPLAGVKNEYNAVYIKGEAVGETMFYGPGAGSMPTATAVVSDIMAVVKNMLLGITGKSNLIAGLDKEITPDERRFAKFYVRLHVKDKAGVFASISQLFHDKEISFERIIQRPASKNQLAEVILVTHQTSLANFQTTLEQLQEMESLESIQSYYRVEGVEKND